MNTDAQTVGSAKRAKFHVNPENVDLTVASGEKILKYQKVAIYNQILIFIRCGACVGEPCFHQDCSCQQGCQVEVQTIVFKLILIDVTISM